MSEKYIVYTDGACSNNQAAGGQPGGWGAVFLDGRELSGGADSTTNNRMELTAVIEALKTIPKGSSIDINSDSAYIINAFKQNWISNWKKRGWKTSQGKPVENQDLWKELIPLVEQNRVNWVKVKGHSGDKWNDIADRLAVEAIPITNANNSKNKKKIVSESTVTTEGKVTLTISESNYDLLLKILDKIKDKDPRYLAIYKELSSN